MVRSRTDPREPKPDTGVDHNAKGIPMNSIIYLVGLVVVVIAVLSFVGLR